MQVDPTLMNVGDGGTVSREASAPDKVSPSMVGNPPQTLPPELRGDAALSQQSKNPPAKDCNKAKKNFLESNSYNHNPEVPPPIPLNNAPTSGPLLPSSEKRGEQRSDTAKVKADSVGLFATSKWVGGSRIRQEDPLNASHSNVAASKKSQAQTQSVISLPPGFQCSTIFKPGQPVAFVPSTNLSSPLGQIAALREATASQIAALREATASQIAALREATASQIHKEIPPQSPGSGGTSLQRTYPYPFSVGRTPNPEKKAGASISKLKSSLSLNKSSKSVGEHKSLASVVASTAIALPLQHPSLGSAPPTRFTLSPTAAICCAPSLATITTQSRLLNHVEKSNKEDKTSTGCLNPKPTCASEDDAEGCPAEQRDVPLDLSAKSKRPKCLKDPLNIVCVSEHHHNETNQRDAPSIKRSNTTIYSSAVQYPVLPNTHRNGSHQKQTNRLPSRPVVEAKSSWGKGPSQDSIKNIPGTYVGVASPILASTLRGKDGKGTFVDEFQNFAKQEFISIVDQGEHLASKGKKPLYLMKGNQHSHSVKHVNSTSTVPTKNCTSKGATITALAGSAAAPQGLGTGKTTVPFPSAVGKPAWQQPAILTNQGASVQKKVSQGSPKAKGSVNSEVSMFQNAQRSPSKTEDDKWDRGKSPLSNLESIVKQKALETTALTGEGYAQTSPVAVRKADVLNPPPGGQDPQPKHTLEYPPSWTAEKNDWKKSGLPSQRASTQIMNRLGRAKVTEGGEISTEIQTCQSNREQQVCWKAAAFRGNASINGSRMESKLARVLEGELTKEQSGTSDDAPSEKFQGVVHSILTGQCLKGPDKVENKTNGTKEKSPTKAKSAVNKQKIAITKKPGKEKSLPDPSKKAMATVKKRQDKESTPLKVTCLKKQKRQCAPVLEGSASADTPCSQNKEEAPNDRSCFQRGERAILNTLDGGGSLPRLDTTVSPSCSISSKTPKSPESSTPRLRRGRRRCDEAHLEDPWGFAAPSPPPPAASFWSPPSPPPPPPSPPPPAPTQPARRPRGRPRSNPVPGDAGPAKAKLLPTTEGDAPAHKKRRRCRNRKYQGGEYIVEKDKLEDGERDKGPDSPTQDTANAEDSQTSLSPSLRSTSPVTAIQVPLFTRSGSGRYHESEVSPEGPDKPSGKRKFKSKHLSNNEEQKFKAKRSSSGKRSAPLAIDNESNGAKKPASPPSTPKGLPSPPPSKKGSRGWGNGPESPAKKPVPPEVRRLIVNKNAGETLLQRAARLGYQDVVLYCLEKDIREVNRRDNAGYTALHEASSRGWTRIVQILLKHGADVNCSAQDGTRPIHDAVASDNLPIVWLLLNHGADPTLATYSGHTAVKLAHSPNMKTFLTEYFTDLEGRSEQDPSLLWDFYSSSVFESEQESCWEFLLSEQNGEQEEKGRGPNERDSEKDGLLFEFSSEPLLPCYHVQVSLTQGFCNWFLLTDVLRRLKMSARIFRARYPHLEVVSLAGGELWRQVAVSQVSGALATPHRDKRKEVEDEGEDEEGQVELVRCVPELQRLLGSSIHILQEEEEEEEEERDREAEHTYLGRPCGR